MADKKTKNAATGAMSGAATGAMVGSVVPGIGTAAGAIGGAIIGGLGGLFGDDGSEEYERAMRILEAVESPQFNPADLQPADFAVVAKYFPKLYKTIELSNPELVQQNAQIFQEQQAVSEQLKQQANTRGLTLNEKVALQDATDQANRQMAGQMGSIRQEYANRGMGGGAMEASQAMNAQRQNAQDVSRQKMNAALMAQQRQGQALQNYGSYLGNMQNQQTNLSGQNADIKNRFTLTRFQNAQDVANRNTDTQNEGSMFNLTNAQDIANKNINNANMGKQWRTKAAMDKANFNLSKAAAMAGQSNTLGQVRDADGAALQNNMNSLGNTALTYALMRGKGTKTEK